MKSFNRFYSEKTNEEKATLLFMDLDIQRTEIQKRESSEDGSGSGSSTQIT